MSSEKGQDETANAIFKAFKSYKHSVETGRSENEGSVKDPEDTADSKNVKEDVKPQVTDDTVDSTVPEKETDFFWAVQFYVSQVKMSKTSSKFKGLKDIREVKEGKTYKYTTGEIEDQDDAVNLQSKVRKLGFKDAFVVGFSNGKKVSYKEAVEISKQK